MIEYRVEGGAFYTLSYRELMNKYQEFTSMTDGEFMSKIPEALHLACVICFLKEYGWQVLGDKGIIHELVHQLHLEEKNNTSIADLRKLFNQTLCL